MTRNRKTKIGVDNENTCNKVNLCNSNIFIRCALYRGTVTCIYMYIYPAKPVREVKRHQGVPRDVGHASNRGFLYEPRARRGGGGG